MIDLFYMFYITELENNIFEFKDNNAGPSLPFSIGKIISTKLLKSRKIAVFESTNTIKPMYNYHHLGTKK